MIELNRHIEILLLSNDCVIVPNLGGFVAHHVNAQYDTTDGSYLPPMRTIGFNAQLKINDHLLVQSYIEAYDISYPEALRRVEDEVEELKQHLDNEGEYEFRDLGILSLNSEGNYQFVPFESGILSPSLYGLALLKISPVSELIKQKEEEKTAELPVSIPTDSEEKSETTEEEVKQEVGNEAIVIRMSWLRNVAVVAAAILMFFFFSSPIENAQSTNGVQQSSIIPLRNSAVQENAEVQQQAVNTVSEDKESATEEVRETATNSGGKFSIVLASQTIIRLAESFVENIRQEGLNEAHIQKMNNSDKVRVLYGAYATEEEAQSALKMLRTTNRNVFKEAWVLKTK